MMSELSPPAPSRRRRRADAERSSAAILDAACRVWSVRPDASIEDIAAAADVTRQTVYAHYASRELLLGAVVERARADAAAAIDAALAAASPAAALVRLLRSSWQILARYPFLLDSAMTPMSAQEAQEQHEPRLAWLIRRGQDTGDFDRSLSPTWLLAVLVGLHQAARAEVDAGRMTAADAATALEHSILRVFGVAGAPAADADH